LLLAALGIATVKILLSGLANPSVAATTNPGGSAPVRLAVTRDTWFSNAGSEGLCNLGGAAKLKLKSYQEMSLIDTDPSRLLGHVIENVTLHVRSTGEPRLARVTVSSFGADWVEGTSTGYQPQKGSSCHLFRQYPDVPWSFPGSDLCSVILGEGGTTWGTSNASAADAAGWQEVPVAPRVLAARLAKLSYGFLLFDDTGSEWTREGEKFKVRHFPNRFIFSHEAGAHSAPYFDVTLGPEDREAPAVPGNLRIETADLPAGEAWLSWITPADQGPAGTLGFHVTVNAAETPRYLIPLADKPGERVRMRLRDLGLRAGAKIEVTVRAVDAAGNVGEAATGSGVVSSLEVPPLMPAALEKYSATNGDKKSSGLPTLGAAEVAVLDELDKIDPVAGSMIPPHPEGYLTQNHLWNAAKREIVLYSAANEIVGFQLMFHGTAKGVLPELRFPENLQAETSFARYGYVTSSKGPLPDPLVPLTRAFEMSAPDKDGEPWPYASMHVEIYVPHGRPAGDYRGTLSLQGGADKLEIAVLLHVWDFELPDFLSFIPEMNTYGLPSEERGFYRLAHRHRTVLNCLPYGQNGIIEKGCVPYWTGTAFVWTDWDRRFGGYFNGAAFAGLPRAGVPLDCFYLPLHENWPSPMEGNYNGDYWADRAFPASYRETFVRTSRLFAEHFNHKGWNDTIFQVFLNDKNNFKSRGWSRGASPWLLDEPANFQDFWAVHYYGGAFQEGIRQAPGTAKVCFRADISRPMWQRDFMDDVLDYNVVGGMLRRYPRMVSDRKEATGQMLLEYGTTNAITSANVQPAAWCIDAWTLGCDGVVPWQSVGNQDSWQRADQLALLYPPGSAAAPGRAAPVPSVRLKAYCRGQQDVEYLTLYQQASKQPRWAVAAQARSVLGFAEERLATEGGGAEDAGVITYRNLAAEDLWRLRIRVGSMLSSMRPQRKSRLVSWSKVPRTPHEDWFVRSQK
jgi:hypothetical protein